MTQRYMYRRFQLHLLPVFDYYRNWLTFVIKGMDEEYKRYNVM